MSTSSKFVLCLPCGGFNDMLCQIEKCVRYARSNQRVLLLDTSYSGLHDDIRNYFTLAFACEVAHPEDYGYKTRVDAGDLVISQTGNAEDIRLRLDDENRVGDQIKRPSEETLVVHYSPGGGDLAIKSLEKMHPLDLVQKGILSGLPVTDRPYIAIHIRNTDYRTDYEKAFSALEDKVRGKTVVLCSDDERSVSYFVETYSDICDVQLSKSDRSSDGRPLHGDVVGDVFANNISMLTDLFTLAFAERLYMVDTQNTKRSGFSVLAAHMLRRLSGLNTGDPFSWNSRIQVWIRSLSRGAMFRVWRNRCVQKNGKETYLAHPTFE
jgi:hypothetical protein